MENTTYAVILNMKRKVIGAKYKLANMIAKMTITSKVFGKYINEKNREFLTNPANVKLK